MTKQGNRAGTRTDGAQGIGPKSSKESATSYVSVEEAAKTVYGGIQWLSSVFQDRAYYAAQYAREFAKNDWYRDIDDLSEFDDDDDICSLYAIYNEDEDKYVTTMDIFVRWCLCLGFPVPDKARECVFNIYTEPESILEPCLLDSWQLPKAISYVFGQLYWTYGWELGYKRNEERLDAEARNGQVSLVDDFSLIKECPESVVVLSTIWAGAIDTFQSHTDPRKITVSPTSFVQWAEGKGVPIHPALRPLLEPTSEGEGLGLPPQAPASPEARSGAVGARRKGRDKS